MIIAIDFDHVIIDPTQSFEDFYHAKYNPDTILQKDSYPSLWEVFYNKKEECKKFINDHAYSEYFDRGTLVHGAYKGIRELKKQGHDLFVLSSCSGDEDIRLRRQKHAERLLGTDILSDLITIHQFETKADIVQKKGASVLIDDSPINIIDVIQKGINGILFRCAANSNVLNQIMSGVSEEDIKTSFWKKFDSQLLREKALIANDWNDVVKIIADMTS